VLAAACFFALQGCGTPELPPHHFIHQDAAAAVELDPRWQGRVSGTARFGMPDDFLFHIMYPRRLDGVVPGQAEVERETALVVASLLRQLRTTSFPPDERTTVVVYALVPNDAKPGERALRTLGTMRYDHKIRRLTFEGEAGHRLSLENPRCEIHECRPERSPGQPELPRL